MTSICLWAEARGLASGLGGLGVVSILGHPVVGVSLLSEHPGVHVLLRSHGV